MGMEAMDVSDSEDAWEAYTLGKDGMDVRDAGYAMDITYSMDGNGCYGCQGYCGCLGCL